MCPLLTSNLSLSPHRLAALHQALLCLLDKFILTPFCGSVPGVLLQPVHYPKIQRGGIHPNMDLKALNVYIQVHQFQTELTIFVITSLHERFSGFCGHERWLLAYTYLASAPAFPEVCCRVSGLPVSFSAFWPVMGTSGVGSSVDPVALSWHLHGGILK